MIALIPMDMKVSITHFKFDGDLPHVGDIYASFGVLIEKNSAALIMCICDGEREFDRRYVAELLDTDRSNTAIMSFNPRRIPKIIAQLKREFLCEWSGGVPFIQYRGLIGEDYNVSNPEKPLVYPNTGSHMGVIFAAMGFTVEEPLADEDDENCPLTVYTAHGSIELRTDDTSGETSEVAPHTRVSSVFNDFFNTEEWKH